MSAHGTCSACRRYYRWSDAPEEVCGPCHAAGSGVLCTALGGALERRRGGWYWSDGERATGLRDDSDPWNFRCRGSGGETYVEIPRGVAQETDALAWVIEGARAGRYRSGVSGDHTGPLVLDGAGAPRRAHIRPGDDPLLGSEPLPELAGPIPSVILVLIGEWDRRMAAYVDGALWPTEQTEAILAHARALGWSGGEA